MKLSQTLLLTAQLVALAISDFVPTVQDYANKIELSGADALAYLFNYDPSRPHPSDASTNPITNTTTYRSYESNYIQRLCRPRSWTGEAGDAADFSAMKGMTAEEGQEYQKSYNYSLNYFRQAYSASPYPCERTGWIATECGINSFTYEGEQVPGKGTPEEQNACLCRSDYFAAHEACISCTVLHSGNTTFGEEDASIQSSVSSAVCAGPATITQSIFEYWSSVDRRGVYNTTIVSDGAQNKTDVSLYYTGSVDFVPATIQEPAFTRTLSSGEVVMTPGTLAAKATAVKTSAAATGGLATSSAAAAATSAAGAENIRVPTGIMFGVFGALLML